MTTLNARRQPPPYSIRLTALDIAALRDRAKLEQVPPTALAREILRGYLKDKATKQEAALSH
jgi:hypothetical protein